MTTTEPTVPTLQEMDERIRALETGANSWAALVGEDVRVLRQDLDALREVIDRLVAEQGD